MKKSFLGLFISALMLVGCSGGTVLKDEAHDYFVSGAFAGWGDATTAKDEDGNLKYLMEAVAVNDERVKSLKKDLKGATMLYVYEGIELAEGEEWGEEFRVNEDDEELTSFNGGLSVKVLQTAVGEEAPIYWAQNKESGRVKNLTPDKLFIAPYQEDDAWEDSGTWASNLFANEPGTYTMVFGKMPVDGDATLVMGLI